MDPSQIPSSSLQIFRQNHPAHSLQIAGAHWQYFAGGSKGECIVLLHGAGGTGEMYYEYFSNLENAFLVLAPSLPPEVATLDAALRGLVAILDSRNLSACHVFGHSHGGYLAQELARRFPDRVRTLMLSGTALPGESHARKIERQLPLLRFFPSSILGIGIRYAIRRMMRSAGSSLSADRRQALSDQVDALVQGSALAQSMRSTSALQLEYHRQTLGPERWKGPVLLFETGGDPLISQQEFAALRQHYPQAEALRFEHADHFHVVASPFSYTGTIGPFVSKHANLAR